MASFLGAIPPRLAAAYRDQWSADYAASTSGTLPQLSLINAEDD